MPFTLAFHGTREAALRFSEYSWTDDPFTSPADTTRPRLCPGSIAARTSRSKITIGVFDDNGPSRFMPRFPDSQPISRIRGDAAICLTFLPFLLDNGLPFVINSA
jgi:hypothetical protein